MNAYQHEFIQLSLKLGALRFGDFTLKSGRRSPYFFNIGTFSSGKTLARLGLFYAAMIQEKGIKFDMLFGPAYKGIPLAICTAIAFAEHFDQEIPYAFNRKEIKDHGEGGLLVGKPLQGKVLIIDDVITAGTAVLESIDIITKSNAKPCAIAIALDRQERNSSGVPLSEMFQKKYQIPILSIICFEDLLHYLEEEKELKIYKQAMLDYRAQYGA